MSIFLQFTMNPVKNATGTQPMAFFYWTQMNLRISLLPPIYGRRTSGMRTEPSACRLFSKNAISIRGGATTVLFKMWYDKLWKNTVDLFRSMDIPVRTLECCSGDLADLKVKSVDVEAWSPRQKKYFEVGSCSNLGDAQARRLKIRVNGKDGKYFAHTLNNTVVAPPVTTLLRIMNGGIQ